MIPQVRYTHARYLEAASTLLGEGKLQHAGFYTLFYRFISTLSSLPLSHFLWSHASFGQQDAFGFLGIYGLLGMDFSQEKGFHLGLPGEAGLFLEGWRCRRKMFGGRIQRANSTWLVQNIIDYYFLLETNECICL